MTTGLVVSVTDELVAELEALANECGQHGANWYEQRHMAAFPEYPCDQDFVVAASPATILALLAERVELKRDAGRYRHILENAVSKHSAEQTPVLVCQFYLPADGWREEVSRRIDAAVSLGAIHD